MMNHYRKALKGSIIFKNNMIQDYYWTSVAYTIDYVRLFNENNPMTAEQESILHAFMKQEVRLQKKSILDMLNVLTIKVLQFIFLIISGK